MFESFILGLVQGIAEWLPISSEAMIVLVKNNFFPGDSTFSEMISLAIFLHMGTLLAVVVYYWRTIVELVNDVFRYKSLEKRRQESIQFLCIATVISGIVGIIFLQLVERYEALFANEFIINIFVAIFLIITAILLYVSENKKTHGKENLSRKKAFIVGVFQGFAAIPGISRSGSTIAGMGILGIKKERALELSFLLSIPIIFLANIFLNIDTFFNFSLNYLIGLVTAFFFGIITIEILLRIVRRVRFSYFVGSFALFLLLFSLFS